MTWFKDWFNSPYYHQLYFNRDDKEAEAFIDKLIGYLKQHAGCGLWQGQALYSTGQ